MKPKYTKDVASFVRRLRQCRAQTARPSRILWWVASLQMWLLPIEVKQAVCAYNAAVITSGYGINTPVPSAKEKWSRLARKNFGHN